MSGKLSVVILASPHQKRVRYSECEGVCVCVCVFVRGRETERERERRSKQKEKEKRSFEQRIFS